MADAVVEEIRPDVASLVKDVVGEIPAEPEPSPIDIEIDENGTVVEPVQKKEEPAPEPKPDQKQDLESTESKKEANDPEPQEDTSADPLASRTDKLTVYQEKNEWRRRAREAEEKAAKLDEKINQLLGKFEVLEKSTGQPVETPDADPLQGISDDEFLSAGQVKKLLQVQEQRRVQQEQAAVHERQQQERKVLEYVDQIGAGFYDDWNQILEPAIEKFRSDPDFIRNVLSRPSAPQAARYIYEQAKKLQTPVTEVKLDTSKPTTVIPVVPTAPVKPVAATQNLTGRERDLLLNAISRCTDLDQLARLEARLAQLNGGG